MQSNYSTAKGASTHRKRNRNNGYTDHDNPLHRPGGGTSKAGLDQTFSQEAAQDALLPRETPAAVPTPLGRPAINRWAIDTGPRLDLTHRVVLREIARYADDAPKTITVNGLLVHLEAGECCPTQETLAEGLDATDRTIRNSVRNLRGLGLLTHSPNARRRRQAADLPAGRRRCRLAAGPQERKGKPPDHRRLPNPGGRPGPEPGGGPPAHRLPGIPAQ